MVAMIHPSIQKGFLAGDTCKNSIPLLLSLSSGRAVLEEAYLILLLRFAFGNYKVDVMAGLRIQTTFAQL
jgi:hypothetical protein